jgi:uncharacterized protein (DUF4415 family)
MTTKNKSKRGKKIQYGSVEIPTDAFESRNVKMRVTAFIDEDIIDGLKKRATAKGTKYQTLMNQLLREAVFGKSVDEDLKKEIREIVREEISKKAS